MRQIDILLATYNGAAYLPELLESLENQTFGNWRLLVRDDGSSDTSLAIVEDWAAASNVDLLILSGGPCGLGASKNFSALIAASDAPYFALCDQDDVWLPEKLALMMAALVTVEKTRTAETPLLAYSDLTVVNAQLKEIHPSFREYTNRQTPEPGRLMHLLMIDNIVTGCASFGNAALREIALPIPNEAMMHDWWLALVAGAFGELIDVPQATILYRQHAQNAIGATSTSYVSGVRKVAKDPVSAMRRVGAFIERTQRQAHAYSVQFGDRLDKVTMELFSNYSQLQKIPYHKRIKYVSKQRLWGKGVARKIVLFLSL